MLKDPVSLVQQPFHWPSPHPSRPASPNHSVPSAIWSRAMPDPILTQLQRENSAWQRVKSALAVKSSLYKSIKKLADGDPNTDWAANKQALTLAFTSVDYPHLRCSLRKILTKLSESQLKEVFHSLMETSVSSGQASLINNCLDLISLEEMEAFLHAPFNEIENRIQTNAALWENSLQSQSASREKQAKYSLASAINFIHCLLDTILMAFRFFEMGKEPSSSWEASHFIQVYGQLLTFPVILLTLLNGFIASPGTAFLITAGAVFGLASALMAYVKWLKPCPQHVEPFINLTQEALEGRLKPVHYRDEEMSKIIRCFTGSEESRQHPILVGLPGVGKSELVNGLAWKITHGQIPSLKNKQVFAVNAGDLLNSFSSENKLRKAIQRIGKHGKDVILFIDEAQVAYRENNTYLGAQLLTVLGMGKGSLPFCILATTPQGYQDCLAAQAQEQNGLSHDGLAFSRRTNKIDVTPTDKPQTVRILRDMLLREAPEIEETPGMLESIFKIASELKRAQPDISKRILGQALSSLKMQERSDSPELHAKKKEAEELLSQYQLYFHQPEGQQILAQLDALRAGIIPLQEAQERENVAQAHLNNIKKQKSLQKSNLLELAFKVSQERDGPELQKLKKQLLFVYHYCLPHLEQELVKHKGSARDSLDETLIQRLVEEERAKQDKR